eukprot:1615094-Pyramimonas_sp.AAC.1
METLYEMIQFSVESTQCRYAPSLQELLIMPESESDALKESHLVGCALVEMDKPVNNEVIACEGRWEAI